MEENKVVQSNLECKTPFGESILHILVANGHNELAKKVFQKNASLLKAQDKHLQTPLHYAAKAGNVKIIRDLIRLDRDEVKNALKETDDDIDTAFHYAVMHGHVDVVLKLLKLNRELLYMVNKEERSPFHIAIVESQTLVAQSMLVVDSSLGYTRFSNGMFPIHLAARIGNAKLVKLLLETCSDSAKLQDQHGRTFLHVAVEENKIKVFKEILDFPPVMFERLLKTKDYDGNTPFHIAAMKGDKEIMYELWSARWRLVSDSPLTEPNNQGLTLFDLSAIQVSNTIYKDNEYWIEMYVRESGRMFSVNWFFTIMDPLRPKKSYRERNQVIGLGSALITTVVFAAAFTVPGGYNADHGTPIRGRRFMYRAFTFANTFAFLQAFLSVFAIVVSGAVDQFDNCTFAVVASYTFVSAANCMVLSFGTGSYVMLAPVSLPAAIMVLVVVLLVASPTVLIFYSFLSAGLKRMGELIKLFIGCCVLPFVFIFGLLLF